MKLKVKTRATLLIAIFMISSMILVVPAIAKKVGATIQDGTIVDIAGNPITVGYDIFGYNYQAHMFRGRYCDYDRVIGGPYSDVGLIMKWNDAWLSNMDRDGDNLLDRHDGHTNYIDSGAWLTNHQWGTNPDGKKWTYFVKIVAVKTGDTSSGGIWYDAAGNEIGPVLWGAFAVIQRVSNDPMYNEHGCIYNSPSPTGFGHYK